MDRDRAARSAEDKIEIIFLYGECGRNYRATARRFNEIYPERPITCAYVYKLVTKFRETQSVKDRPRSGRPKVDDVTEIEVIGRVNVDGVTSLRQLCNESNVPKSTIATILRRHKFHPYKMHIKQELTEDDFDRRIQFCEVMLEIIAGNDQFLKNICFSESTFSLNGFVNKHNVRCWSDSNPHILREGHTQRPEKVNVWAGILGDHIIGPLFIDMTLTGNLYLELLTGTIDPLITNLVENSRDDEGNLEFDMDNIVFQQDGCPAHYARQVRTYLDEIYPNRWIGRRGPIEWPARSPDLASNDFFLWGYLKSVVYKTVCNDIEDLKARITTACKDISKQTFQNVRQEFYDRLFYCQEVNGAHFEQLLQ